MLNTKRFLCFCTVWLCGVPALCYLLFIFDCGVACYIFAAAMILSQVLVAVVPKFAQRPRKLLYILLAVLYVLVLIVFNLCHLAPFFFLMSYIVLLPICIVLYILNMFEIQLVVCSEKGDKNE